MSCMTDLFFFSVSVNEAKFLSVLKSDSFSRSFCWPVIVESCDLKVSRGRIEPAVYPLGDLLGSTR